MCVGRDVCRGRSGLSQIICESMLHMQAQCVEGVLQGVVIGVDPVLLEGAFARVDRLF